MGKLSKTLTILGGAVLAGVAYSLWKDKQDLEEENDELYDEIANLKIPNNVDNKSAFFKLLKEPEVLNKSFIYDQYDANIQTNTISESQTPRLINGSTKGIKAQERAM